MKCDESGMVKPLEQTDVKAVRKGNTQTPSQLEIW